jgi:hypothetical protein
MKLIKLALLLAALAAPAIAAHAQTVTIIEPQITITDFYAFPHEGSANKLSSSYDYPAVKGIDVLLRFEVKGIQGEQKAVAFVAMVSDGKTLAKQKEKLLVQNGKYEIVMPEVLMLNRVYGEHDVEMAVELAVVGVPSGRKDAHFKIKGRELPKVEVLDYWIGQGGDARYNGFEPGDNVDGELVFKLSNADNADINIRIVGVMDEEYSFTIDPREQYQRYDAYWGETRGPRRDGTYLLGFNAYLPRYFYQPGYSHHDFTIYVVFEASDQIIRLVGLRDTIVDYRPGQHRSADDELMRVLQIAPSETWRLRAIRAYQQEDYENRWFDET